VEHLLGSIPRKLHDVETHYAAYNHKLLATHQNPMHWEPYLSNRHTAVYTDHTLLQHILSRKKLSSRQWRHRDKLQQIDLSINYFPWAANLVADALSRIHHPVSTTPATISINTMELQIIGAEEWKQEVWVVLLEDGYFGPIDNLLPEKTDVIEDAENRVSEHSEQMHHQ